MTTTWIRVTDMIEISFFPATAPGGGILMWVVADMSDMFSRATVLNGDNISKWVASGVKK